MNIIFLILGSVLTAIFIILMMRGSKYDNMLELLEMDIFPLKSIYSAGLTLANTSFAKMQGKIADSLRKNSGLIYEKKYAEYYAHIIWAQVLSFVIFILAIFFNLAGLMSDTFSALLFAVFGLFAAGFIGYYFYNYTKSKVENRRNECEIEFPNAISKMALLVNSGMILHTAWETVAYGKEGDLYDLMKLSCEEMNNGKSEIEALHDFGVLTDSDEIKKFTTALIQDLERGGGELPNFLANESLELWNLKRQKLLQKGEKAASTLIAPIGLMFIGVILIILAAAMQSMSF